MDKLRRLFAKIEEEQRPYYYTLAVCEECNWEGVPADCETGWEQDGWENPKYEVAYCPKCKESSVVFYKEEQKND